MRNRLRQAWRHLVHDERGFIGLAIPAGIAIAGALAGKKKGGDKDDAVINPYLDDLSKGAQGLRQQGQDLNLQGSEALAPALQYLRQILSTNPNEVMAATAPERGRVIDQYDAARRAIGEFGPRGGGTTSALAESRISEAGALGDILSTGRREAFGQAAQLGTTMTGLGLTADQLASADIEKIIDAILTREGFDVQKRGQTMQMWSSIGQAAGYAAGAAF